MKAIIIILIFTIFQVGNLFSLETNEQIPSVYKNLKYSNGELIFENTESGNSYKLKKMNDGITIKNIQNPAKGSDTGLEFDFMDTRLNGIMYYGLYQDNNSKFKYPIFLNKSAEIKNGKSSLNILSDFAGKKDICNWQKKGIAKFGYRIINDAGKILYDGKLVFSGTGPFKVIPHLTEGPFVNCVTDTSVVISYSTNVEYNPKVYINSVSYSESSQNLNHQININNLMPDTEYTYKIECAGYTESHTFRTNPKNNFKGPFKFAFSSDSRTGYGGGERDLNGVNAYIMKKSAALAYQQGVRFFQFTGDMITGYLQSFDETLLQYTNWKRTVEQYAAKIPFYTGMGNHESLNFIFDDNSIYGMAVDKFPFEKFSAEKAFSESIVNFNNGPHSEDNSKYDPNPNINDFPKYEDQVYSYRYGNTGVVVLNSNYFYSPSISSIENIGGNLHSYIMDNQLRWLDSVIVSMESDNSIDHIFISIHTPAFPNGGHSHDAMWYKGSNSPRPIISGKKAEKGIIERRDEFLDIICNKTTKVVALLTGDEHNYSRMKITDKMQRYTDNYEGKRINIKNPIWQIVNGAAGAPYYGQEDLPWSDSVEFFTSEHILCIFEINGNNVNLEVFNPETLELIEEVKLK